jgi:rhodanese-related sulfurtransferase
MKNISAEELSWYMNHPEYEIIDVRSYQDYRRAHVKHAVHIDSSEIEKGRMEKIRKQKLVLYCDRGGESLRMAKILSEKGFFVWNVIGGFYEIKNYPQLVE